MKKLFRTVLTVILVLLMLWQALPVWAVESGIKDEAKSQILIEMSTGTVLYEENADEALPMASITKMMGLILIGEAMENQELSMNDVLSCSEYAKSMGGSEIWLKAGEQMTVEELLKAVMIVSANDTMMVFAEKIGSTEDGFVQMMNQKAGEMGLSNTHFVNAVGFDEDGHYTSARDIAKMAQELQKYPQILQYATIWMDSLRDGETMLVNTNRLVRFYEGTTGLKTGTTDWAGHCLCATAERNGMSLCAVVLGCKSSDGRFEASKELLNYGFSNYSVYVPEIPQMEPIKVSHGTKEQARLTAQLPEGMVILREEAHDISMEFPELEVWSAPLELGQQVGELLIRSGEKEIGRFPICVAEAVEELNFSKCFQLLLKETLSIAETQAS